MRKKLLAVLTCGFLLSCGTALAQSTNDVQQSSTSAAQNNGVVTTITQNTLPPSPFTKQEIDNHFNTTQANTAPAVIGSAAPSTGGCPAIEGWSTSLAVINGGKSNAVELPGCMANQLSDRVERLKLNPDGTWSWSAVIQLEAWCSYPLYKTILERSHRYTCQETIERQHALQASVLAAQPQYTDSIVRARLGLPPLK